VFTHEPERAACVKKPLMRNKQNADRLPSAAERKKISDRAKQALTQAWALQEYLDKWESKMEGPGWETAAHRRHPSGKTARPPNQP
jgi:hypothetical protein